ncbi:MAG TPA: OmpA family protein, partial [Nitrosomonas europaea]|nr:OmpA family protein [Nitrosomonas europaea]
MKKMILARKYLMGAVILPGLLASGAVMANTHEEERQGLSMVDKAEAYAVDDRGVVHRASLEERTA